MTRSASPSIRGYSYQFHKSALELLSLDNENDSITLEGIEDIDKISNNQNELVQVKYLASSKLVSSSISVPASLMLKDYAENKTARLTTKYRIYAYFGESSNDDTFWTQDAFFDTCRRKLIEADASMDTKLTPEIINEFKELFTLEIGEPIESIEIKLKTKLIEIFNLSEKEVSLYQHPNAINLILQLSHQRTTQERTITKAEFLEKINNKNLLYGIWKSIEIGKQNAIREINLQLKKSDFLNIKRRFIYIDTSFVKADDTGYALTNFISDLLHH